MQKFKHAVFMTTIGLLQLTALLSLLIALLVAAYALFEVRPFIKASDGSVTGILSFEKGIPVPVAGYVSFEDSVMKFRLMHSDRYSVSERRIGDVKQIQLISGNLGLESKKRGVRCLLCLPDILFFLWMAMGSWQIAKLLHNVVDGNAFNLQNYRRIRNVGLLIIEYEIVMIIYHICSAYWYIRADSAPEKAGLSAERQLIFRPDFDFSFTWIAIGIMLIIISLAFKTGETMKQEQDLTI